MSVYAVNSKEPIAAWIPTLSQSMEDLAGVFDATLSGGASIANDGGGLYSLSLPNASALATVGGTWTGEIGAISFWAKIPASSSTFNPLELLGTAGRGFTLYYRNTRQFRITWSADSGDAYVYTSTGLTDSVWMHIVVNLASLQLYRNGAYDLLTSGATYLYAAAANRFTGNGQFYFDDFRIFGTGVSLDAADVAYLYNSGSGRGRIAVTTESRRRRQSVSGGVL